MGRLFFGLVVVVSPSLMACDEECARKAADAVYVSAGIARDPIDGYAPCSNETGAPIPMTVTVNEVERVCAQMTAGVICQTTVQGLSDDWGPTCAAGFGVVAPGYFVHFDVGTKLIVSARRIISEGGGSSSGVVRSQDGRVLVGASWTGVPFRDSDLFGLTVKTEEEEDCELRLSASFSSKGNTCTLHEGEAAHCTLWNETYDVRLPIAEDGGLSFIVTLPELIEPGDVDGG